MKLLVIVICLLSERFLSHAIAHNRFHWFANYGNNIEQWMLKTKALSSPWAMLATVMIPLLLVVFLVLHFLDGVFFGFVGLVLNVVIFYYCLGPVNPFYPVRKHEESEPVTEASISDYLIGVNGQVFAVVFWFIVLGPIGALLYRLTRLCIDRPAVSEEALHFTELLDWLPVRMTALLYLLVGNFQSGLGEYSHLFFESPTKNQAFLSTCGLQALGHEEEELSMTRAETLVEHAIIALLVLIAFFTLGAWI